MPWPEVATCAGFHFTFSSHRTHKDTAYTPRAAYRVLSFGSDVTFIAVGPRIIWTHAMVNHRDTREGGGSVRPSRVRGGIVWCAGSRLTSLYASRCDGEGLRYYRCSIRFVSGYVRVICSCLFESARNSRVKVRVQLKSK